MSDLYYYAVSKKTGHPYMTDDLTFSAYDTQQQAEAFAAKKADVGVSGPRNRLYLLQQGYSIGARKIRFCKGGGIKDEKIEKRLSSEKYYNPELNAAVIMAKQTRKYDWIRQLKDKTVIMAIRFRDPLTIRTQYATVHKKGQSEYLYLAFTDLDEYSAWLSRDTVSLKDFLPVEMPFQTFYQLCCKRGCMFNPAGNRLILQPDTLKNVYEGG